MNIVREKRDDAKLEIVPGAIYILDSGQHVMIIRANGPGDDDLFTAIVLEKGNCIICATSETRVKNVLTMAKAHRFRGTLEIEVK